MEERLAREEARMSSGDVAERALRCLGRGFDLTSDFRAKYCKGKEKLIIINEEEKQELIVPGFGPLRGVSVDVKCDKGERLRYQSNVLNFDRMSELFNQRSSVAGRIPSGLFNAMFAFGGSSWAQDATETKCLAMDGYFISLFNLRIDRRQLGLSDHVIREVPSSWDPSALARFIDKYGTHVIVGLSVGGKDVIYVRQDRSSKMYPSELKRHLDRLGDQMFTGTCTIPPINFKSRENRLKVPEAFKIFNPQPVILDGFTTVSCKDGLTVICAKRGGDASTSSHCEWLPTVSAMPDIINFTFVPITSLLKAVPGAGFLSHAINLYLRYKPPISDLEYFLDFQSHKAWAPMLNDHPLGPSSNRPISTPALNFNLMGPKLYVNTSQVIVAGRRPVTGMRIHLEGKKNNRLAIHLQHISNTPAFIGDQPDKVLLWQGSDTTHADDGYYEPIQRKKFSHVCTAPVDYDPWSTTKGAAFTVTGAQLIVKPRDSTSTVLHLRLLFSVVPGCTVSQSRWERGGLSSSGFSQKSSSFMSTFSNGIASERDWQGPIAMVDSGVFPTGPPAPVQDQKLLRFVDTSHVCMGPEDTPGYWMATGAKLDLGNGKIGLHVKFSLLTPTS